MATFQEAVEVRDSRQDYLDSIDLDGTRIKGLKYIPEQAYRGKDPVVARVVSLSSPVLIFSEAFSRRRHKSEDEFDSTVIDHEGFHIAQRLGNSALESRLAHPPFDAELICRLEVEAYQNQLSNPYGRVLSAEFIRKLKISLGLYQTLLGL